MQGMTSVRAFLHICLRVSCPGTAWMVRQSAGMQYPAEILSIKSNGLVLRTQKAKRFFFVRISAHRDILNKEQ